MKEKPIFISYAREDLNIALKIYEKLKKANVNAWIDDEEVELGDAWEHKIENVIENCRFFIALLSNNYIKKIGFVQSEIKKALNILKKYPPNKKFILPIRIENCLPPYPLLEKIHWIDLFEDWDEGIQKIIKVTSKNNNLDSKIEFQKIKLETIAKKIYQLREVIFYSAYFLDKYGSYHDVEPDERDDLERLEKEYDSLHTTIKNEYSLDYDPLSKML